MKFTKWPHGVEVVYYLIVNLNLFEFPHTLLTSKQCGHVFSDFFSSLYSNFKDLISDKDWIYKTIEINCWNNIKNPNNW